MCSRRLATLPAEAPTSESLRWASRGLHPQCPKEVMCDYHMTVLRHAQPEKYPRATKAPTQAVLPPRPLSSEKVLGRNRPSGSPISGVNPGPRVWQPPALLKGGRSRSMSPPSFRGTTDRVRGDSHTLPAFIPSSFWAVAPSSCTPTLCLDYPPRLPLFCHFLLGLLSSRLCSGPAFSPQ